METIGTRLRLMRKQLNMTQEQLAQRLGVGKAALSMIETRIINGYQIQGEMMMRSTIFATSNTSLHRLLMSGKGRKYQEK